MSDYNKRIYELLNREKSDMLDHLPQPNMLFRRPAGDLPTLHGGRRPRDKPLPGYFYPEEPATLATGSNIGSMMPTDDKYAMRRYAKENDLDEMEMSGGKINWSKVGKSLKKGLSTAGKYATPILKEVGKEAMPIIKKEGIKALKNYLLPAAEFTAENPEILMAAAGRARKPRKRMSKAIREMSDEDSDSDGSIHVDINSHKNGGKRVNARAEIVKRVMREKGLKMIEASKYVKAHGLY
jgi:hypothetical protein